MREKEKRGRRPPTSLRHMGSALNAEAGCRKIYAGKVFERHKNSLHQEITLVCICRLIINDI